MRWLLLLLATPALACEAPVCRVAEDSLRFTRIITFDTLPSGMGVGRELPGIIDQDGARFGEHFLGQSRIEDTVYDRFAGDPVAPLTLQPGAARENLGTMMLWGTTVLHGHGPALFPNANAVGEGSIAVLFDRDQPALAFDIRGGEAGAAAVTFLRRDGTVLHRIALGDLAEGAVTFLRADQTPDIAGILIENTDPEGIGIDNLRFEFTELMGALPAPAPTKPFAPS
ncbi:hypothetical protein ACOXXX_10470 [Thalassococcus sp. BH17M4-6]|uniref:hypothetical protein n=1 Tax=Thalassococcus sp. BH17M4-6 TaxID=3413148 RepID=UPI003BBCD37F